MRGALLIFLLLISCVVAKEIYPWQNLYWSYSNPYVFHFANLEVWDVWSMHKTLDSLTLDQIHYEQLSDPKTTTKIQEAKFNYEKA
ncbi:hypothetical protein HYT84_02540, partial [Candidatus Micrarchaeota archaeon]|nr:hypothetical protein [Candidatus Micrarchaeota archaeon]